MGDIHSAKQPYMHTPGNAERDQPLDKSLLLGAALVLSERSETRKLLHAE
jgi:hypothetical protein